MTTMTTEQLEALIAEKAGRVFQRLQGAKEAGEADRKAAYRLLHEPAVEVQLEKGEPWITKHYPDYQRFFAQGTDVYPEQVAPVLIEVVEPWQADLFRLARYTWSLPYTRGYGRRLRFLIMDASNDKLIGVLGLQSPPLDFAVRDQLFTYPEERKTELINQTMDAYTVGALPPYSTLLGGKLVALAIASDEVRAAYRKKYRGRQTNMEGRMLPARLVAVTTTSAYGRSSIYNRLRYDDRLVAHSLGYTSGYGSFHLNGMYPLMREYLEQQGVSTSGGFGSGPRIVWQTCVRALEQALGSRELLRHGIRREAYLFPLIANLEGYLAGRTKRPAYYRQSFRDVSDYWRERWLLPRAERVPTWKGWHRDELERHLLPKA